MGMDLLQQWTAEKKCWELLVLSMNHIHMNWKKKLLLLVYLLEEPMQQEPR